MILAGAVFILACVAVNQMGQGLWQFTTALMALGVGWNFMFIGGTSLLTGVTARAEQAKVQGFNDFLMFGAVALAAMSGGMLHQNLGWEVLNYAVVPGIAASLVATLWLWPARQVRGAGCPPHHHGVVASRGEFWHVPATFGVAPVGRPMDGMRRP